MKGQHDLNQHLVDLKIPCLIYWTFVVLFISSIAAC